VARHRRHRSARWVGLLAVAALGLVWASTTGTRSSWTAGVVSNPTNSGATGSLAFTHTYPGSSCALGARVSGPVTCTGGLTPTAAASAGGVSASDSVANVGTVPDTAITSEFRATSCAPVSLADVQTAADPMLPRYATSFGHTDPWGTTSAIALSGGAYAADVSTTSTVSLLGSSFSLGVWFKVASGYSSGGALLGLAASASDGASVAGSPLVWMDDSGKIRFSLSGTLGIPATGVSASSYNDGNWHLAVLSVTWAVLGSVPTLYVDNAAGVSAGALSLLTGTLAYWHTGWGDFTTVANAPTSATLTGSLSGAFTTSSAISSATRSSLFAAASANAYRTAVLGLSGLDHLWMFGDTGTTTYAGSLPVVGATSPCTMVDVTWALSGPAGTVSSAGTRLSTLADGTWHAVPAPAPGSTQTSTITVARDATWSSYVAGLRLHVPLEHRLTASSAWTATLAWAGPSAVFLS
jgi:hypothetical protein